MRLAIQGSRDRTADRTGRGRAAMQQGRRAAQEFFGAILLVLATSAALAQPASPIERIEPPNWWAGMKSQKLQLMVHGSGIAQFTPRLRHPQVTIERVFRPENPNYLFIDLKLGAALRPGELVFEFRRGKEVLSHRYPMLQRLPHSAVRKGFSRADVILNIVPDRFANGDPGNDRVPGYADKLDRSDDSAGRHGGDIAGIVQHLDYIAGMGYTMLWPTPLTQSNQAHYSYHGYAATDTYRIDPRYGSNADYKRLVELARAKGIGVIQDIVLNHIGSGHWWLKDMPMKNWLSHDGEFIPTRHARTAVHDPYAAADDKRNFTQGWFERDMPDMNQRNPYVAIYQIQNAIWWIEYAALSGARVDTYGYSDATFLAEWSRRVMAEYPNFNLVGEEWSHHPHVVAYWQRGRKNHDGYVSHLPSLMDYPLHTRLRKALVEADSLHSGLASLYEELVNDGLYADPGNLVLFEGNHDVSRLYSELNEDLDLYKMALAYILTLRRIPQFYYGTEILMTSPKQRDDGAFRRDFPGGWPGDTVNAFTGAGLSPSQLEAQQHLRKLLNWRKSQPVVHDGTLKHFAPENAVYVYFRSLGAKQVMVILNKNAAPTPLDARRFREVFAPGRAGVDAVTGQRYVLDQSLVLPPRSALVLELE